jgi:peptide/nickel transport system substrate-binding protein
MAQLSAEFTLRENVKWSDGQPLTSHDSVFSYEIAQGCQIEGAGACGGNGLIIPDQRTVENTAEYTPLDDQVVRWVGVPGFLDPDYQVNFFIPLPQHVLGKFTLEQLFSVNESTRTPLGWGAYKIDTWEPGEFIRLSANHHYFRAGEELPHFDVLIYRFVGSEPDANLAAVTSGACDVLDQEASQLLAGVEIEKTLDLDQQGEIVAHITPGTVWEQVAFGIQQRSYDEGYQLGTHRPDFFSDTRTRQALSMCMDRQRILDEIIPGNLLVPDSYIPPTHPLYNPDVAHYEYDPQAGMALLEEVGWVDHDSNPSTPRVAQGVHNVLDGTELSLQFLTSSGAQRQQASIILAESLTNCGIQIELKVLPADEVYAEGPHGPVFGRQFDLVQLAWLTGHRPPCNLFTSDEVMGPPEGSWIPLGRMDELEFLYGWGGQNLTGFSNIEYDSACYDALAALPGQEGYLEAHFKAQQIFATQLPVVPLFLHPKVALTQPDLTGFVLDASATSELWNIEELDRVDR